MTDLFDRLTFKRGPAMANRFMLAPMTNLQSNPDGTLSGEEHRWLAMRANGGFGSVMTAGAYVQPNGQGFPGQIAISDDKHVPGLARLAAEVKATGSVLLLQLFHAGMRGNSELTGLPIVAPSSDAEMAAQVKALSEESGTVPVDTLEAPGAQAMTLGEIEEMVEAFVVAAERAERAGFDGVELHGAHTYLLCAFLSSDYNRRTDRYGGSLDNRARPIREIIAGIRKRCGSNFNLGLRLSPERMGLKLAEMLKLAQELMNEGQLDYIDMSLWDAFKAPEEEEFKGRPLISWFADLDRGETRLGVAGQIHSAAVARACLDHGADFVMFGRAGILHHDFPQRVRADPDFKMASPPISEAYLESEGLSAPFIGYLRSWPGFIAAEQG